MFCSRQKRFTIKFPKTNMRSMCDEDCNAMIADQYHPKEALDLLQKNYASLLNSNILRLKDEFHAFTLDPSKTVMENISS